MWDHSPAGTKGGHRLGYTNALVGCSVDQYRKLATLEEVGKFSVRSFQGDPMKIPSEIKKQSFFCGRVGSDRDKEDVQSIGCVHFLHPTGFHVEFLMKVILLSCYDFQKPANKGFAVSEGFGVCTGGADNRGKAGLLQMRPEFRSPSLSPEAETGVICTEGPAWHTDPHPDPLQDLLEDLPSDRAEEEAPSRAKEYVNSSALNVFSSVVARLTKRKGSQGIQTLDAQEYHVQSGWSAHHSQSWFRRIRIHFWPNHRPAHKYPVTLHLRFVTASLRRCSMIPQALRSFLGVLTSLCRRRHQRKAVLGARISTMCCDSASAEGTVTVCGGRQQQVTPVPPTTLRCAPGSRTEKMVRRALGESGKGMAQQEEDPAFTGKDHQKRGPDGSRGARSTFRPLGAQRDLSAFVPKPGPLRRNLHAKSSVDRSTKKLQTSCVSSCPQGNAITSSYSSSWRGFPPGRRRTGPGIPRRLLPRRSSRKASEGGLLPPCAAPVASQSNSRSDEDAEATRGQKRTWKIGAPTSDSPRPGRRRFPLLRRRRGEPLRLPPPPELGFRVTAEDLDAEKAAALRRINSALRDETPARQPCGPFPAPADPPAPGRAPRPDRYQRESASPAPVDTRASAGGASSAHPCFQYFNGKKGSPENHTQQSGKSGLPHWGLPGQSPSMVTMGPRAKNKPSAKNKPGFGGFTAPIFNHMPGGAPRQSPRSSS
ncbi:hypothetical protein E5288_WYG005962 [Bos mutus]|uniref:Uncharacterized protein n=1 Tax=Bos mutus TaxID=72004 RepID=A0A6B0R1F4_9CETA|nr:hypothetical protein [Bos mutus]